MLHSAALAVGPDPLPRTFVSRLLHVVDAECAHVIREFDFGQLRHEVLALPEVLCLPLLQTWLANWLTAQRLHKNGPCSCLFCGVLRKTT